MRNLLMPLGLAVLAAPALAGVDVAVDLPSSAAGTGTLAVRVFSPANLSETRCPEGAPVLIWGPGGTGEGSLSDPLRRATDVIRIVFLFPGGRDLATGRFSGGSYDFRGLASILALRDVLRYASGELADSQGRRIDEVLPVPVLHHDIGLLGSSNGGNIVVAAVALFGSELSGKLRYVIQWESPVSSQITLADLGPAALDCSGNAPRPSFRAPNPRYLGYGPLEVAVDYSQIAYDASSPTYPVFLDGNGNRRYDTVASQTSGCRTPDLSGNNALETSEDFPLSTHTVAGKQYYSRPVTRALRDRGVFGGSWPSSVATVEEADAYWDLREAVRLYPTAAAAISGLEAMVLASLEDHVQVAADHPHIRQAFEGWQSAGAPVQAQPRPLLPARRRLHAGRPHRCPRPRVWRIAQGLERRQFLLPARGRVHRRHAVGRSVADGRPRARPLTQPRTDRHHDADAAAHFASDFLAARDVGTPRSTPTS